MPIYEYECQGCGDRFEQLMGYRDPDPDCPNCGGIEVRKLISNTTFVLKGTGWYVTDYAKPRESGKRSGDTASKDKGSKDTDSTKKDRSQPSSDGAAAA